MEIGSDEHLALAEELEEICDKMTKDLSNNYDYFEASCRSGPWEQYEGFGLYVYDPDNAVGANVYIGDFITSPFGYTHPKNPTVKSCLESIIDACDNWKNSSYYENARQGFYEDAVEEEVQNAINKYEYDGEPQYGVQLTGDFLKDTDILLDVKEFDELCNWDANCALEFILYDVLPNVKEWLQKYIRNNF